MNRRLLWVLLGIIAVGTVLLFWAISMLTQRAELGMSFIDERYQQQILAWGAQAERLHASGQHQALADWLEQLQQQEHTWATVLHMEMTSVAGSPLPDDYVERYRPARDPGWKIHLYFVENPTMSVPFADGQTHFMIKLPQRMRPGAFLPLTLILLQIALPVAVLSVVTLLLYYHLISPLKKLEHASRQFSQNPHPVPIRPQLGDREDEFTALAATFDRMTARIGKLIQQQRNLTANLSHELRTSLTRLEIAIDCLHHDLRPEEALQQLSRCAAAMRSLAEDTLTLAWLENEQPDLRTETVCLPELLDVVCEDARFEYPDRQLQLHTPAELTLHHSSHRALGQALENLIRNALRHTPAGRSVRVQVSHADPQCHIDVIDEGPGVSSEHLPHLFEPFYRVPSSDENHPHQHQGFGLGLTLAQHQIEAVGGQLQASNHPDGGLQMRVTLPLQPDLLC